MQKKSVELIMLGTGNAAATKCYNTCFALKNQDEYLLTDAGGGNGILIQLEKARIPLTQIHHIYVTHAHTDHILGVLWMIRMIAQSMKKGDYTGDLHIWGNDKVMEVLSWISRNTLPKSITHYLNNGIFLREVKDGDQLEAAGMSLTCFDIHSTKEKQFGFSALLPDGQKLVCLGDEPYNNKNEELVKDADWLLCEAFCLYDDREIFKPYEKHHSTARDAGLLATELQVKNLLLFHTEDKTLASRKAKYSAEAKKVFNGAIFVPEDLERIDLGLSESE